MPGHQPADPGGHDGDEGREKATEEPSEGATKEELPIEVHGLSNVLLGHGADVDDVGNQPGNGEQPHEHRGDALKREVDGHHCFGHHDETENPGKEEGQNAHGEKLPAFEEVGPAVGRLTDAFGPFREDHVGDDGTEDPEHVGAGDGLQAGQDPHEDRRADRQQHDPAQGADSGEDDRLIAASLADPLRAGENVIRQAFISRAEIGGRHCIENRISDDHADAQRDQLHRGHARLELQDEEQKNADDVINVQGGQKRDQTGEQDAQHRKIDQIEVGGVENELEKFHAQLPPLGVRFRG